MKRILVPVDFSTFSLQALRYGCALARQDGAELFLLHVVQELVPPVGIGGGGVILSSPTDYVGQQESSANEALAKVPPKSWLEGLSVRRQTVIGSPRISIVDFAKENEIDLICLGTHGRGGFSRMLLGSVAEKVVQHAPCNVLVVRRQEREFVDEEHPEPALKRILVPVDFSDTSQTALEQGAALAIQFQAELHLLHVVEDNSPSVSQVALAYPVFQSYVHEIVKAGQTQLDGLAMSKCPPGLTIRRKVVLGSAIDKINNYADEHGIDLIVLGTHGRTGPSHWLLGSVAERVVRSAPCPVLVTPMRPASSTRSFIPAEVVAVS